MKYENKNIYLIPAIIIELDYEMRFYYHLSISFYFLKFKKIKGFLIRRLNPKKQILKIKKECFEHYVKNKTTGKLELVL